MITRNQRLAQKAFDQVLIRKSNNKKHDEYLGFSKSFPALIHNCGLAQAITFGLAKDKSGYLDDLASVIGTNKAKLANEARTSELPVYQRLTLDTIASATWLKQYAEALLAEDK